MNQNIEPPPTGNEGGDDLLRKVQAYLQCQLQRLVPEALLTEAWEQFYPLYTDVIRGFAIARHVPRDQIDDVVQEVWTDVTKHIVDLRWPSSRPGLRAWFNTLVQSKAADIVRERARHPVQSLNTLPEAELERVDEHAVDPATVLDRHWEDEMVNAVLVQIRKEVPELNFRLLQLHWIDGRTVPQIAAEVGLTPQRVWSRLHRLLRKMRSAIALYTGEHFGSRP